MSPLFVREGLRDLGKFNRRLPKLVWELYTNFAEIVGNTNAGFHVRRDSNPNFLNIINPLELIVLCCMLYRPVQFRASGYIWGWLFDISDSPYKFRLNSSGCVLHSPAELKFIRGAKKVQKSIKGLHTNLSNYYYYYFLFNALFGHR